MFVVILKSPVLNKHGRPGLEVITLFMLNSTEHNIILLIKVKMPTIVDVLTFIGRMNTMQQKSLFFIMLIFISNCNFMLI